jgi:hypothetical protein
MLVALALTAPTASPSPADCATDVDPPTTTSDAVETYDDIAIVYAMLVEGVSTVTIQP